MERDLDGAAWERARQLRARAEDDLHQRAEDEARATAERRAAEAASDRRKSRRVVALGATLVAVVLAGTVALLLDVGSDGSEPSWRQELPASGDLPDSGPQRLAPVPADAAGPADANATAPNRLDAEDPPVIDMTGDDFERVWRQAQLLEGWLLRHPDPELAGRIYLEGSPAHTRVVEVLTQLRAAGQRVEVFGYRVAQVTLEERVGPDEAVIRYVDTHEGRDVVDVSTGAVVQHEEADGRAQEWEMLLRRVDGEWRVVDIRFVDYVELTG